MIKLLLVDNEPTVLKGLRMRLSAEPDMTIVGEAADGTAALALARTLHPDVVLMDVEMPHPDGIAATKALHEICPHMAVIMLTMHDDAALRVRAEAAGVAAFVTKRAATDALLTAIRQVSCKASNGSG